VETDPEAVAADFEKEDWLTWSLEDWTLAQCAASHILRPPAPVEVKKTGLCAFVQKPLLGYNQGESPSTAHR
jgi:hypothetical protein